MYTINKSYLNVNIVNYVKDRSFEEGTYIVDATLLLNSFRAEFVELYCNTCMYQHAYIHHIGRKHE